MLSAWDMPADEWRSLRRLFCPRHPALLSTLFTPRLLLGLWPSIYASRCSTTMWSALAGERGCVCFGGCVWKLGNDWL